MNGKFHKIFRTTTIVCVVIGTIAGLLLHADIDDDLYTILAPLSALGSVSFFYAIYSLVRYCYLHQDQEMIKKKEEQQQLIIDFEYQQAVASQKLTEPWAKRYELSACPHCGHYKVRKANWDDKRISVAFWGAASTKIGKSYICDHCERMW